MKQKKFMYVLLIYAMLGALFSVLVLEVFEEDRETLVAENRKANSIEKASVTGVFEGTWMKQLESYFMDQFPARDTWMRNAYRIKRLLGEKESNGYVIGLDDYILAVTETVEDEQTEGDIWAYLNTIDKLNKELDGYDCRLIAVDIPHKNTFCSEYYPKIYRDKQSIYYDNMQLKHWFLGEKKIDFLDTMPVLLEHKNEYLYFKTDNHFTGRGAYYVASELINHINDSYEEDLCFFELADAKIEVNSERFVGSYLKKMGDDGEDYGDYLQYIYPNNYPIKYKRYENGESSNLPLFNMQQNTYGAFMSGDYGDTIVDTFRDELPNILFVGRSYTNALEYFSVYSFNEVHSIDPRHFEGNIMDYIDLHSLDYIVVVRDDVYDSFEGNKCTFW